MVFLLVIGAIGFMFGGFPMFFGAILGAVCLWIAFFSLLFVYGLITS